MNDELAGVLNRHLVAVVARAASDVIADTVNRAVTEEGRAHTLEEIECEVLFALAQEFAKRSRGGNPLN